MRCLSALARLTSTYVFGNVDVLADPERTGKVPHERPGLSPSGPSWHSRSTCSRRPPPVI